MINRGSSGHQDDVPRRGLAGTPGSVVQEIDTAAVFREHGPFVWRVLRRLGVPESDTADVCQEVFVVIHRRRADFEGRSSIRTWIYGICVRAASDYRRRVRRRREDITDAVPEQVVDPQGERALMMRDAQRTLDRVLDALDEDKRAVFVLYEIEQLTMTDVATAVGCPLQTAYSRLHAARARVEAGIVEARQHNERGREVAS